MKTQTLKQLLFSPEGRINRKKFILTLLSLDIFFGVVYAIILCYIANAFYLDRGFYRMEEVSEITRAVHAANTSNTLSILRFCLSVLSITTIYSAIVLNIKRFHDLNKSGWCFLLGRIPIINIFVMLILVFKKGTQGANQYGEDPLA